MKTRIAALLVVSVLLSSCTEPSKGDQFWWTWGTNLAVALATLCAVGAALCGPFLTDKIRAKWFAPRLKLKLLSPDGELNQNQYTVRAVTKIEPRRFYHLHVSNDEPYASSADGVQVSLLGIETPGPGGSLQLLWRGNIPLTWRNQQISPLQRTIGPAYDCDLCSIGADLGLSLALLIFPLGLNVQNLTGPQEFVLSIRATATKAHSEAFLIKIAWDGKWDVSDSGMMKHVVIKEL